MRDELRKRRLELGLTQAQVAAKAEISKKTYSHIELGIRNPSLRVTQKLADILGISDIHLF